LLRIQPSNPDVAKKTASYVDPKPVAGVDT